MQARPPAEWNKKILNGAERGDVDEVELAVAVGANVNCTNGVS